jgi:hypothetical protein
MSKIKMIELKLSNLHNTDRELCYKKHLRNWQLFDDTDKPIQRIAIISGNDLDGWQWQGTCDKLANFWQQTTHFQTWRAALVTAAMAYINNQ